MTNINQNSGGNHSQGQVNSNTRRALLKGSAASLPVLLSFRSGAANAITSSEQCIDGAAAITNIPNKFVNNVDNFLRREVRRVRLIEVEESSPGAGDWLAQINSGGNHKRINVYQPLSPAASETDKFLSTGNNQREVVATGTSINYTDSSGALVNAERFDHENGTVYVLDVDQTRFGLVVVGDDGLPLEDGFSVDESLMFSPTLSPRIGRFVDGIKDGQNHMTGSCWTSFSVA